MAYPTSLPGAYGGRSAGQYVDPVTPPERHPGLRRRVPTASILAVVQVLGSLLASRWQPERHDVDAIAVALLLVGPLSLLLGRRWPLVPVAVAGAAACAFIGLGYPFGPVFASPAVSVFLAIQAGRRRGVLALAPLLIIGFSLAGALDAQHEPSPWLHALILAGWLVAVIAVSEIVRARRVQAAEQAHLEAVAREQRLTDERMRLAQELHDVLAHNISLINVQASTALHLVGKQPERAAEALGHVKRASAEALGELRAALDVLREGVSPRTPAPRLDDLPALLDGVRAGGLDVHLIRDGYRADLPGMVELTAYRIAQEALTNVTRHSTARSVTVQLTIDDAALAVEVVDDGSRATLPAHTDGRGLLGMRERVAALGGQFTAGPTPTGGFRVHARLPLTTS